MNAAESIKGDLDVRTKRTEELLESVVEIDHLLTGDPPGDYLG